MVDAVKKAVTIVKANGGVISFDPNIRKEMLDIPEMRDALHFVLELTDIYMPSEGEVLLLSPHSTPERAIAGFLEEGVKEVIVKRGNQGASYYSANEQFHVESYPVEEVDPTGAGDCFGGAWIACRQLGFDAHRALQYANACGALAVTRRGPMEERLALWKSKRSSSAMTCPFGKQHNEKRNLVVDWRSRRLPELNTMSYVVAEQRGQKRLMSVLVRDWHLRW